MRRTAVIPFLLVALLAACSASTDNSTAGSKSAGVAPQARTQAAADVPLPRAVVRTARIDVHVKDPQVAADKAAALAAREQGRVDSDERTEAGEGTATLVLRIPPALVERTLTEVAKLGRETSRSVSDKDVTSETVDVASRVATQRASVARVRALLARAESLTDITRIEGELTRREADLESLQNRQKALDGQIDLASVTVTFSGSGVTTGPAHHAGFIDGLSGGWTALTGTARVLAVVAGALLPWSWIVLLALAARLAWRRRRPAAV
jgi:hypothetical protein